MNLTVRTRSCIRNCVRVSVSFIICHGSRSLVLLCFNLAFPCKFSEEPDPSDCQDILFEFTNKHRTIAKAENFFYIQTVQVVPDIVHGQWCGVAIRVDKIHQDASDADFSDMDIGITNGSYTGVADGWLRHRSLCIASGLTAWQEGDVALLSAYTEGDQTRLCVAKRLPGDRRLMRTMSVGFEQRAQFAVSARGHFKYSIVAMRPSERLPFSQAEIDAHQGSD